MAVESHEIIRSAMVHLQKVLSLGRSRQVTPGHARARHARRNSPGLLKGAQGRGPALDTWGPALDGFHPAAW